MAVTAHLIVEVEVAEVEVVGTEPLVDVATALERLLMGVAAAEAEAEVL